MKKRTKTILVWIPSVAAGLFIVMGAIMKFAALPQLVDIYSKIGLLPLMDILGTTEILLVVLFLFNRSMKIGFYLLTGYFGGAMAVEMSHGTFFIMPAMILVVVWVAAYLRDPSIFRSVQKNKTIVFNT